MEISKTSVYITYKNWKGVIGIRKIQPIKIWWGNNEYHPVEQWFLHAMDMEKNEERNFAMRDIIHWWGNEGIIEEN